MPWCDGPRGRGTGGRRGSRGRSVLHAALAAALCQALASPRGPAAAAGAGPVPAAVVPACITKALASEVQGELAALNFTFLANDCAQAFYVVQDADGAWGGPEGARQASSPPPHARRTALERLTERLAEAVGGAARRPAERLHPAVRGAPVRGGHVLGPTVPAGSKRRRCGGGRDRRHGRAAQSGAKAGVLGGAQVVVLRKNCYRLCGRGGDFFGRIPSRSAVRCPYVLRSLLAAAVCALACLRAHGAVQTLCALPATALTASARARARCTSRARLSVICCASLPLHCRARPQRTR